MKNAHLVWMLERPSVYAIVRGVESAFGEPRNASVFKATVADRFEWAVPMEGFSRCLKIDKFGQREMIRSDKMGIVLIDVTVR